MKNVMMFVFLLSAITSIHGLITRIFGGSNAPERKYPYYAFLHGDGKVQGQTMRFFCGGSIINKRWILTAAHCFKKIDFKDINVQVGSVLRTGKGGVIYRVEKRIDHEAFNETTYANDIALFRVKKDIVFNEKVRPTALANSHTITGNEEDVVFLGFGRIQDLTSPEILQTVVLKMYNYEGCKDVIPITEAQICTIPENGKGPCSGDSGGPLIDQNGIQIGIDSGSYGENLSSCGKVPEIYTRISSYRDWIDENIKQN